ncbi:MAG: hypothetical protein L3J52_06810 [Proteobacteria bacterium]|nr:hypothetical protein [Pseudomonadota bacterium]
MFPKADIILIEPDQNDEMMFNTNLFSYAQRSNICEYAYQQTRKQIKTKKTSINQILQRHGFSITDYHLNDPNRTIESFIHKQAPKSNSINSLNHSLNELDRLIKSM